MLKNRFRKIYWLSLFIIFLFNITPVFAADPATPVEHEFILNVPIGELDSFTIYPSDAGGTGGNTILGEYIKAWYGFLLGTIGIMATVMIMWGGVKYLISRGDSSSITQAKSVIISAITGVVLAFSTYTLLSLVNPQLLTISMPDLAAIQGGDNVELNASENEATAQPAAGASKPAPLEPSAIVTSANWPALQGNATFVQNAENALSELNQIGALPAGFRITSSNRPNARNPNSQHITGNAMDVTWPGITQASAEAFVDRLQAANPGLSTIIETNGEHGSTWSVNNNNVGMGVHIDGRPGTPYHER